MGEITAPDTAVGEMPQGASGVFPWEREPSTEEGPVFCWDKETLWRGFPRAFDEAAWRLPDWAIGPFSRHPANPVLSPTPGAWDGGRFGGGVHNGSILVVGDTFHYVYRGEKDLEPDLLPGHSIGYVGDIGLATSRNGVRFRKETTCSPFFRKGEDRRYSFEDVCCVWHDGRYYLFCNRWYWPDVWNPAVNGVFLATSTDLRRWTPRGLCFPGASRIHRNPAMSRPRERRGTGRRGLRDVSEPRPRRLLGRSDPLAVARRARPLARGRELRGARRLARGCPR